MYTEVNFFRVEKANMKDDTEVMKSSSVSKSPVSEEHSLRGLVFEDAPLPYQCLDEEGRILFVNQEWLKMLGYKKRDVIGSWFGNYLTSESVEIFRHRFNVFLNTGQVSDGEFTMICRDGSRIKVVVNGRISRNEQGEFLQTHCILHNISEKKRTRDELLSSERRFRGLFESSLDGIAFVDMEATILNVNPALCAMVGRSEDELLGKNARDLAPVESFDTAWAAYKKALINREDMPEIAQELIHAEGHRVRTSIRFWVISDDGKAPTGVWINVKDLSRVVQAEEALRHTESQYKRIVETANEGIIGLDAGKCIVFSNQVLADFVGYDRIELLGQPVSKIFPPSDSEDWAERISLSSLDAEERYESPFIRKDGTTVWGLISASRLMSESGEQTGSFAMIADITKRKRFEADLRESERKYRHIYEHAMEGLYQTSPDGRFLSANPTMARILGYDSPEELVYAISDVRHQLYVNPVDRDILIQEMEQHGRLNTRECQFLRRDGSVFWGLQNSRIVRDERGRVMMFEASLVDISERKEAEKALERSQELLNEVQRISMTGGWEVDLQSGEISWTDGQIDLFGEKREQMPNRLADLLRRYVHVEDQPMFRSNWDRMLQKREPFELEFRIVKGDGKEAVLLFKGVPEIDAYGDIRRVFGATLDVTKERMAARELAQSHQRMLTILDGIDADIYVSEIDSYEVLFMNDHMRNSFGSTHGNICYKAFRKKDEPCGFCPKLDLLDENGDPVETIISERHNPITNRWYLNHDRAILWLEGKLVHMHMAADITALKEMEKDLKEAMSRAEEASTAKNEFLANMSHEIRTPLNGLLGMLQILQMGNLKKHQREHLETALESGRNLLQILNDILDLSKIESGMLDFDEQETQLGEVLESVVSVFRHTASMRGVNVEWSIDERLPFTFLLDHGRLRQILFNLVGNATKFTEEGMVTVEAYPLPIPLKDGRMRIFFSVTDTGIGIPSDKISRIFDPFTQVDGSVTRKYQGTGLGLGIVHRLVTLMNGTITVDSRLSQGTTIAFTVAAQPMQASARSMKKSLQNNSNMELNILVAEDEHVNRVVVERLLAKLGHQSVCVENGEQAVDMLMERQFDCLLTDIQMPGMDGVETTRVIRNKLGLKIPIVALTAHAMKGDRQRFMESGMNGYVAKPFDMSDLQAELSRVMQEAEN